MKNFLDCSNHQSNINLSKVQSDCFIFKATEGRGWRDGSLSGFVRQARSLDKPVGFYHFISQKNTPQQEADNFLSYTQSAGGRLDSDLMVNDWEPGGNNPSKTNVGWALEFNEYLRARIPNPIWTYMNLSTANGSNWKPLTAKFPLLWLAHYPGNNKSNGYTPAGARGNLNGSNEWQLAAWQFTDGGRLSGFNGNLDLNELYIPWWERQQSAPADPREAAEPVADLITIPNIRENDPKVWIATPNSVNKKGGWGCVCMQITLPLVDAEMRRRGLVKQGVDYFQFGYNKGGVAASAGTHDGAGVVDCAQGITLEQRKVWAEFGWMMAPRTRQWGWTTGDHGHGVLHGCVHRSASAARQVRDMMNGLNGLVSNRRVNWESPKRTWQDAVRQITTAVIQTNKKIKEKDPMPETRENLNIRFNHKGDSKFDYSRDPDAPVIGADVVGPIVYDINAIITGPEGSYVSARLAFLDRKERKWVGRSTEIPGVGNTLNFSKLGQTGHPECSIYVDVKCDKPGEVHIEQTAHFWK